MERCRHINKPRVQLQGVRVKLKNAVDDELIYWAETGHREIVLWNKKREERVGRTGNSGKDQHTLPCVKQMANGSYYITQGAQLGAL